MCLSIVEARNSGFRRPIRLIIGERYDYTASIVRGEGFTRSPGEISMPKFSTSESTELLEAIDALGLRAARQRGDAFQSFSPVPQSISRIIQKTELRVNEEGTEAAVATAVTLTRAASVDSDFVKMVVDNAFISIGKSKRPTLIGK